MLPVMLHVQRVEGWPTKKTPDQGMALHRSLKASSNSSTGEYLVQLLAFALHTTPGKAQISCIGCPSFESWKVLTWDNTVVVYTAFILPFPFVARVCLKQLMWLSCQLPALCTTSPAISQPLATWDCHLTAEEPVLIHNKSVSTKFTFLHRDQRISSQINITGNQCRSVYFSDSYWILLVSSITREAGRKMSRIFTDLFFF